MLSKEVAEKTHELRKLSGEELQGLDMNELMKLEKLLEGKLNRVLKTKVLWISNAFKIFQGDKILKEIDALKNKEAQLMEENARLRQEVRVSVLWTYLMVKQMLFHKATHHGQSPTTVSQFILLRAAIALTLPSSWAYLSPTEQQGSEAFIGKE
ncbi:unnamed protein product [Ilex paraguariensis]|uniref:K-box domain-containing protein n=1 Tax=Ilex paraguariensis TaxID=185542 RepID=A0ABC8TX71_9AQUA